ncbi:UDP-glycosyltransferase 91A1-like [Ricinus communis]|uniref:UDP-glycosyltransferase 91A1-like n=1 Tax=Ricinus communis TaxID=3988 RepID=UPI00201A57D6|nr:UDP-glycosyltransferase 91A1-like [Ricinus communis]
MANDSKLHIAMFPWLAFGHMIPYLELAKLIAQKGHKISFISTPRNINRLPKLPPNLIPFINFVELPLPHVDGLPEDAEATTDVPYNEVQYLKNAYDGLKEPITIFLETSNPDWLLYDFTAYWLPNIASNLSISHAYFSIFLGAVLGVTAKPHSLTDDRTKPEEFTVPPKWVPFPTKVAFRLFEIMKISDSATCNANGISDIDRLQDVVRGCEMVAIRSCSEFEPEWLNLLEKLHRKPCIPVGMLSTTEYDFGEESESWNSIKLWLDKQEKRSVVYVAFGSEAKTSQEELTEIALGLELSGLPFFWVLRKRRGLTDTEVIELPEGFEERTKGRGVVCNSWAPQLKILAHDSVGGFLTHSGWSSVVEASQYERPLILLTFLADQGINARVLEEKKMGYPIPRNELDGSFTSDSVAESLKLVMEKEEGKIYREKAKEMRRLFGDEDRQEMYVNNFLDYLKSHRGV